MDRNRYDKFTKRARKVLSLAQEEAQRLQHPYIGTEHLLFRFSTSNFAQYYDAFNQFYGVFLFITFCTSFCSLLGCKEEFELPVTKLIEIVDAETRWPELVTWEEMNMVGRKSLWQMLLYSVKGDSHTGRATMSIWQWE